MASGGIATAIDAIEAILVGAIAVQVGTATLIDPMAPVTIAKGIVAELQRRALASPEALRGMVGGVDEQPAPEEQRA
jgi:dihydroorotate dehydrogenase (NAD+) catalytic subunit